MKVTGRKRWWIGAVAVVIVAAAAVMALVTLRSRQAWTTSSPEALAEFEKGIDAEMKLYGREAKRHFERAVALDPHFVMARIMLAQLTAGSKKGSIDALRKLADSVDSSRLTPRERFLVRYIGARLNGRTRAAESLLDSYLGRHPHDPYALNLKANLLWHSGRLAEAMATFERLVKISPNWVVSYNSLGYIAMEQGDFAKSEENFTTYKFIAPDQANPLDSLGELHLLTGRYDEAIGEFRGALRIKRDFCISWDHLATAYLLKGDLDSARKLVARMYSERPCGPRSVRVLRCAVELFPLATAHRWKELLELADKDHCSSTQDVSIELLVHRAGAMTGDLGLCQRIEQHWGALAARAEQGEGPAMARVLLLHAAGVRAAALGDDVTARNAFQKADGMLRYRGSGEGFFKLFNLACLAEVEGAMGNRVAEQRTLARIRRVNPAMATAYVSGRFRPFGLEAARAKASPAHRLP